MRQQSRRLKKKLRLGEFQQLGFEISITLKPNLGIEDLDHFLDEFILDAIERNGLVFGGGTGCGFITTWKRGLAFEAQRTIVENWLSRRHEVVSATLGPLVDAWYPEGSALTLMGCRLGIANSSYTSNSPRLQEAMI